MPVTVEDIKLTVRDLLRNNWDDTGLPEPLSGSDIHTGWYDDGKGFPQVSVGNREESSTSGGTTGFSGIAGDGSGGIQTRTGTVLVTAWVGSRDDYDARGEEELQAQEMATEIGRIVGGNQAPGSFTSLSVGPRTDLVDTDENPTEHAVQFRIRFTWQKTPA